MTNHREDPSGEAGGRFCTVQPERDPEANWEVNLAKKLEEYLLKICSGEIHSGNEEDGQIAVNFAEAALLLQGSVQVYSRKVEYLYSLVLHTLEFISQNSLQEQSEGKSAQPEESGTHAVCDKETDNFWCLDDVPVEAKNCIDGLADSEGPLNQFVKPPANLVVLEGDCLDSTGDGGELESYLLATNELYWDFILLDPCDSVAVHEFLKEVQCGKEQNSAHKGSLAGRNIPSATRRTGGSARKSSLGKGLDVNCNQTSSVDSRFKANSCGQGPDSFSSGNFDGNNQAFDMDDQYSEPEDLYDSDDDDPWKPLNPHAPGNLKVKPFRKVKQSRRHGANSYKKSSVTTLFPLARMHGAISPEFTQIWETRCASEKISNSNSPPLYEKLRQSLLNGDETSAFCNPEDDNERNGFDGGFPDFGQPDDDMPENMDVDDVPEHHEKHDDNIAHFDTNEAYGDEDPDSHASLEDLCRSHLDSLLASIAETEKQTELAARVSTWKQKIEHNLEEQDSRTPFDIHVYGERILDKLSHKAESVKVMPFTDVVKGQEKHDVARTFSALLQLVNNGDVDLERRGIQGESTCYSAVNPFHIRLLKDDQRKVEAQYRSSKKRAKSPKGKGLSKVDGEKLGREQSPAVKSSLERHSTRISGQSNCKFPANGVKCTPEGKRRRRSQLVQPVD